MSNERARRLAAARARANLTQEQVAEALGINRSSVAQWETGRSEPKLNNVLALAGLYCTTPNELLGMPTEARFPQNLVEVPIVCRIPAGKLAFTADNIEGYRLIEAEKLAGGLHFLLRVDGDCMWPRFHHGDYALVRAQDDVEDGELAIVAIGEEATMKRVRRRGEMIALSCDNPPDPARNPILLPARKVRVIGKVVGGEWGKGPHLEASR